MVTVKVGDEDAGDGRGGNACKDKLTLCSLARIEEKALLMPPYEVGAVVAVAGRLLGGGSEDDKIAYTHGFEGV